MASDWIDIGLPPYANDRERQLALDVFHEVETLDSAAPRLTALSKAFARYRIELLGAKPGDLVDLNKQPGGRCEP